MSHSTTLPATLLKCVVLVLTTALAPCQNLEQLLKARAPVLPEGGSQSVQDWKAMLGAFATNDEAKGREIAGRLLNTRLMLTPQQIQAAQMLIKITNPPDPKDDTQEMAQLKTDASQVLADANVAEGNLARIEATAAQLPKTFTRGGPTHVKWMQLDKEKVYWTAERDKFKKSYEALKAKYDTIKSTITAAQEKELIDLASQLSDQNQIDGALALCNSYLRKNPGATAIATKGEQLVQMKQIYARAAELVGAVEKSVMDLVASTKLSAAAAELAKSRTLVESRINDPIERKAFAILLKPIGEDIDRKSEAAGRRAAEIEALAGRDPDAAAKQLSELKALASDLPQIATIESKIEQRRKGIAMGAYEKKLGAVTDLARIDPTAARDLLRQFQKTLSADDSAIMGAKLQAIWKGLWDSELESIRKDMDEGQSFLTKVSANFQSLVQQGDHDAIRAAMKASAATENLARAKALMQGGLKRIELLPVGEMDSILRSRAEGMTTALKSALADIAGTEEMAASNLQLPSVSEKRGIGYGAIGMGVVAAMCLMGVLVLYARSRKRTGAVSS